MWRSEVNRLLLASMTPRRVMLSSTGHQGARPSPAPSGWVQVENRRVLWWNGRAVASVTIDRGPGVRLWMSGQKYWQVKDVRVGSARQARRFAQRWCAARLYPEMQLREAVGYLVEGTPRQLISSQPTPSLTREQLQQAQRLAEACLSSTERVRAALAPSRQPAERTSMANLARRPQGQRPPWSRFTV